MSSANVKEAFSPSKRKPLTSKEMIKEMRQMYSEESDLDLEEIHHKTKRATSSPFLSLSVTRRPVNKPHLSPIMGKNPNNPGPARAAGGRIGG